MTIANFDELCAGVCEVAGCPQPARGTNEDGAQAVSLLLDGVEVLLGEDRARLGGQFFMLVRFGKAPEGRELAACIALLKANSLMLGSNAPRFGWDPVTHDVLLHYACEYDNATAHAVYEAIVRFVQKALEWRETYFLD